MVDGSKWNQENGEFLMSKRLREFGSPAPHKRSLSNGYLVERNEGHLTSGSLKELAYGLDLSSGMGTPIPSNQTSGTISHSNRVLVFGLGDDEVRSSSLLDHGLSVER